MWVAAVSPKKSGGRGRAKSGAYSQHGVKQLRALILELAVRGKLVPQDEGDEPAAVLLERIAAEKAHLVKEKKIKRQKTLPEIEEDEKPFDLPCGWEWARFPDIANYKPGKTPSTKNPVYWADDNSGIPWVSIADMKHFSHIHSTSKKITAESINKVFKYEPIPAGSILMSFKLTVGKITISDVDCYHNEAIISIQPFGRIDKYYLFNILPMCALSGKTKNAIMGNTLNATSLALLMIPLPPLAEQHRIVKKVDELMALCDQLEQQQSTHHETHKTLIDTLLATLTAPSDHKQFQQDWQRIAAHFDHLFITEYSVEQLKQTILQLAVMGKLVRQDSNDEPASVLLEKIAEEKARLIKEKKIKKQKALPEIEEDELNFNLPNISRWERLGNIVEFINGDRGKNYPNKSEYVESGVAFINTGHINPDGSLSKIRMNYISEEKYNSLRSGKIKLGDLVYCLRGATFGKTAFVDGFEKGIIASSLVIIRPSKYINKRYLYLFLTSPFGQSLIKRFDNGSAQPNLSATNVKLFVTPLPPLAEQHRIVTKVDELMTLCEQLKSKINHAQTTQIQLADTLLENGLKHKINR